MRISLSVAYIDRRSLLHAADPLSKAIWLLSIAGYQLLLFAPVVQVIVLISVILTTVIFARIPFKTMLSTSVLWLSLGSLVFIFQALGGSGEVIYEFGPLLFKDRGMLVGITKLATLSSVVLSCLVFTWTTRISDLTAALRYIHVPGVIVHTVYMTLRYLPLISDELEKVKDGHTVRGKLKTSGFKSRIKQIFETWRARLFAISVCSLRRAEQVSVAMVSRGFDVHADRATLDEFNWSKMGIFFLLGFEIFLILLLIFLPWQVTFLSWGERM